MQNLPAITPEQMTLSANSQNSMSNCSPVVHKTLAGLSVELQATGRLKSENTDMLVLSLTKDLAEYPETWVLKAIIEHRRTSPFWPALADLVKRMQPQIDIRAAARNSEMARQQFLRDRQKSLPRPKRLPEAERKAFVLKKLGYDPDDRRSVQQRAWIDECEVRGFTVEEVKKMDNRKLGEVFAQTDKPWHDPAVLKASIKRIDAEMMLTQPDWKPISKET